MFRKLDRAETNRFLIGRKHRRTGIFPDAWLKKLLLIAALLRKSSRPLIDRERSGSRYDNIVAGRGLSYPLI